MNQINLIGNLTRDPETVTKGDFSYCRFSIAVNRDYKNKETNEKITDFFDIVAYRGLAERVGKYCRTGNKVAVTGSVETGKYTDKEGIERKSWSIVAGKVEFLTPKGDASQQAEDAGTAQQGAGHPEPETDYDDGDIPF